MKITLYHNNSEKNKISKTLSSANEFEGTLRDTSNVVNPSILLACDNPTTFNYAYIPAFNRYYFITEMTSVRNDLWQVALKSDPLMSFKSGILSSQVILNETTTTGGNNYLAGRNWVANCKNITDIINFPSGLLDSGEYILITAGG